MITSTVGQLLHKQREQLEYYGAMLCDAARQDLFRNIEARTVKFKTDAVINVAGCGIPRGGEIEAEFNKLVEFYSTASDRVFLGWVPATKAEAVKALDEVLHLFMSRLQLSAIREGMRGEEGQYFIQKAVDLANTIRRMPVTYGQDGLPPDKVVAHLHYFAGGQASWYITEKDREPGDQHQAFGLANLFGDGGELGYISINEIIRHGGELDFHWQPKTLAEIRRGD